MSKIKELPKETKEFVANGHKYTVLDKISPARYKEYEKLVPQITFGLGFKDIFENLKKAFTYLNKSVPEPANAAIVIHNTMKGITDIDDPKKVNPGLMMAALFIVRDDEDQRVYDEGLMLEKIKDWQEEGFDMMSFFGLALGSIRGFRETLIKYTSESLQILESELNKPE